MTKTCPYNNIYEVSEEVELFNKLFASPVINLHFFSISGRAFDSTCVLSSIQCALRSHQSSTTTTAISATTSILPLFSSSDKPAPVLTSHHLYGCYPQPFSYLPCAVVTTNMRYFWHLHIYARYLPILGKKNINIHVSVCSNRYVYSGYRPLCEELSIEIPTGTSNDTFCFVYGIIGVICRELCVQVCINLSVLW